MADKIAWLFVILVFGGLLVGIIGLLMPLLVFCLGYVLAVVAFATLAWLFGRLFA